MKKSCDWLDDEGACNDQGSNPICLRVGEGSHLCNRHYHTLLGMVKSRPLHEAV